MEKFKQLQKIKEIYANGGNIIQYLKGVGSSDRNTIEDILISYDMQAGSYTSLLSKNREFKEQYCKALAHVLDGLGRFGSILEVGVGEATTLGILMKSMRSKPAAIAGLDVSWSRLKFAKELLRDLEVDGAELFVADLFEIPLLDDSIDVVYTSHSIEPNGGREEEALLELYRVARKYVVLLEPSYEFASKEGRERIEHHGYIKDLYGTAKRAGLNVVEHRLFDLSANPLNPTGLIVIEKPASPGNDHALVCPISRTRLLKHSPSLLYSPDSFLAYPVIEGIPCLLNDNSILATHLLTDYSAFKTAHDISFAAV